MLSEAIPSSASPAADCELGDLTSRETQDIPAAMPKAAIEREARAIGRAVQRQFWQDIVAIRGSAVAQNCKSNAAHETYLASAKRNRERLARDRSGRQAD